MCAPLFGVSTLRVQLQVPAAGQSWAVMGNSGQFCYMQLDDKQLNIAASKYFRTSAIPAAEYEQPYVTAAAHS